MTATLEKLYVGIAWCLAWGDKQQPQHDLAVLRQMRDELNKGLDGPEETRAIVKQVQRLQAIPKAEKWFPNTLDELRQQYSELWNQTTQIGLVYGSATKIKQYVFESAKLPDIRGASTLLDRINLIDLPAFFGQYYKAERPNFNQYCRKVREEWLDSYPLASQNSHRFSEVLIPELIIYSTGGNILAFCPAAYVQNLANAIERRYTEETLTANCCAVGDKFKLLEIRFGLLRDSIDTTPWLDWYERANSEKDEVKRKLVQAYFGNLEQNLKKKQNENCSSEPTSVKEAFADRKSFNELTTKLALLFNQRRSGNNFHDRPSRRYPPMFETHPYLVRDGSDRRSAVVIVQPPELPKESRFSEALARKRLVGDRAKKGTPQSFVPDWYRATNLEWRSGVIEGWVDRFEDFLEKNPEQWQKYYRNYDHNEVQIPQSLTQIGKASSGFVAYIYADGNNMGGYIQTIRTPQKYQEFSEDISSATECAVYQALAHNLNPRELRGITDEESTLKEGTPIHPFEILTIGGDDILLIVPADRALAIAKDIGERFEKILLKEVPLHEFPQPGEEIKGDYRIDQPDKPIDLSKYHRYCPQDAELSQCHLSTSIGVLLASYNTPIYYAQKLTAQLLKSAKKRAKTLKKAGYCGGTVDFLTMKSVTMISSSVEEFRKQALTKDRGQKLKLYAAPYTLHELGGLIEAVKALKDANFPKAQLYQIRSFLEQGKHTAILNYRYFRIRLKGRDQQNILKTDFEEAWCKAKTNEGNIAPWMYDSGMLDPDSPEDPAYETIWRELVDIYEFIESSSDAESSDRQPTTTEVNV